MPWTGTECRLAGTSLPARSAVAVVSGVTSTQIPLQQLGLPSAPGCELRVLPDWSTSFHVPRAGSISVGFAVPRDPALAGFVLQHQLVVLETDGVGNVLRGSSSNVLTTSVGSW